jgi:hypothetical protein
MCWGHHYKQLTVDGTQATISAKSCAMSVSIVRNVVCWMLVAITPASLLAADSGAAMLYGRGPVSLNGSPLPQSSAVFPGDLIQTQPESLATLDASGSGVIVLPDSVIKFEGKSVTLERGSVNVSTSVGMVAVAGSVTVTPASNTWTEFEVGNNNGMVQVFASKGSINVYCGKDTANLTEGEQANPDDSGKCNKKKRKPAGALFPGGGGWLTNPYVLGGAAVTTGVIVCLLLCNSSQPFMSQYKP